MGSHARGTARADSDIDIVVLAEDHEAFHADDWLDEIDWGRSGVRPVGWRDIQYGVPWSRHVRLDDDLEVEFGFAPRSWASTAPLDPGTRRIVSDGCRILHDPDGLLTALWVSVSKTSGQTAR